MQPERILPICMECHAYYKAKVEGMSHVLFCFLSHFYCVCTAVEWNANTTGRMIAREIKKRGATD